MTESNVKGFKLSSGEEIICELRKQNDSGNWLIENPILIEWEINANMAPTYDILPWAYAAKLAQPMTLSIFSIMMGPYSIRPDIENKYREMINNLSRVEELNAEAYRSTQLHARRVSTRKG